MAYNLYPAVDEVYNFPPEVRQALARSIELRNTVVPMTTVLRNNLLPAELWDGRTIANTTTDHIERYDAGTSQWKTLVEQTDIPAPTPPGVINQFAGAAAPSGWLLCDGLAVSRTTYASLFGVCGVVYGVGDGSTTFNLPNLKGKVPVGLDSGQTEFNSISKIGGAKTHVLAIGEIPAHSHPLVAGGYHVYNGTNQDAKLDSAGAGPFTTAYTNTSNAGGGGGHNNLQPFITLQYIIKT